MGEIVIFDISNSNDRPHNIRSGRISFMFFFVGEILFCTLSYPSPQIWNGSSLTKIITTHCSLWMLWKVSGLLQY